MIGDSNMVILWILPSPVSVWDMEFESIGIETYSSKF